MSMGKRRPVHCAIAAASIAIASPAWADERDWAQASDVGRDGLMIAALAVPAVHGDLEGVARAGLALAATRLVTDGIKSTIHEERPDESDDRSFPSGHTSMSFSAAATLHKRYGWKYGFPAYAVATFVGAARVKADKHYVHDVVAGAAIGGAAGWLLTNRKDSNVQWLPWGDAHGAGATVAVRF
jgi:membrane-associated phospholipid phosphatase